MIGALKSKGKTVLLGQSASSSLLNLSFLRPSLTLPFVQPQSPTLSTSFLKLTSSSRFSFILATRHSKLTFLPLSTVENGVVVEQGTYPGLMASKGAFFRLQEEHGGNSQKHDEEDEVAEEDAIEQIKGLDIHTRKEKLKIRSGAEGTGKLEVRPSRSHSRRVSLYILADLGFLFISRVDS